MKLYKEKSFKLLFLSAVLLMVGVLSCTSPFEGVEVTLGNNYIKNSVNFAVVDANESASNPYPASAVVTLSGDGITKGLVYNNNGKLLNNKAGSAAVVGNGVALVIKPYTVIDDAAPIKFSIFVEAPGYISASEDVVVTSADDIQYIDLKMIKITAPPEGVAVKQSTVTSLSGGQTTQEATVEVGSVDANSTAPSAALTIATGTVFKNAAGTNITTGNTLSINLVSFSPTSDQSVSSIPGGVSNVTTTTGETTFLTIAGAIDITAFLGTVAVKTFSKPIAAIIFLDPTALNVKTGTVYKEGDALEIWSKDAGITTWKREATSVVSKDSNNRLKVDVSVTHLSIWSATASNAPCSQPLTVNYASNVETTNAHYITIRSRAANGSSANGQIISEKKVTLKNGGSTQFVIPQNVPYTVTLRKGSDILGDLIQRVDVAACGNNASVRYDVPATTPTLFFDLLVSCKVDGKVSNYAYSGAILFKKSGATRYQTFTPATSGKLTTTMLEWDQTYDFRIEDKGKVFDRRRTVLREEFRQVGATSTWNYFGKDPNNRQTFFNQGGICD
jgi:hypothetical protein